MEIFPLFIVGLYGCGIITALVILIYLIIRRRKIKKQEDFEKRDN